MIDTALEERQSKGDNEIRVLTTWRNKRVIRRDISYLQTIVIVQERHQETWIDKMRWIVTADGINYATGRVEFRDNWWSKSKMQQKRIRVFADECRNEIRIARDWRGPPKSEFGRVESLDWQVGSRWRIDGTETERVR